jgi:hypothetical protein
MSASDAGRTSNDLEGAGDAQRAPTRTMSLRERGAQTVRALSAVGRQLFPLRERRAAGETLTAAELEQLEALETQYRDLEAELHVLMRPRDQDPWLRGLDHAHGPDVSQE